jgi:two-component system chemotaxis sensor kinase CheA
MDKKGKILIVEDNIPTAEAMKIKLEAENFEAKLAYNGEEGLNALAEDNYDLVIIDLVMPEMDGFTLIAKMKENKDKTPMMVVSNLGQEEDEGRAKELGVKEYLIKTNISLDDIVEKVKEFAK